jgi:3'-phosphoadenosine 5'-phosphosulfate (PAPS) 3'-phosphatase
VSDYSSQALVNTILARTFPDDPVVGEEDANDLRNDADPNAIFQCKRIVSLAFEALREEPVSEHREEADGGWGARLVTLPMISLMRSTGVIIPVGDTVVRISFRSMIHSGQRMSLHRMYQYRYVDSRPHRRHKRLLV